MQEEMSRYKRSLIDPDVFSITWEFVPGRGSFEKSQVAVITGAEQAAAGGRVHGVTITDNPGGNPAISVEMLGSEIARLGIEPLVHFSCKDKNRNQLEALLHGMERASIHNLLIMTGDYTYSGFKSRAKPVFDLDATQLLELITALNKGLEVPTLKGTAKLAPTHFFAGAVVSPFKATEPEVVTQYYKLEKKLRAGARFIVTQLGYDARKFHEVLMMMKYLGFGDVPVIGNVYVLSRPVARLMNRGGVPGCVVTDKLLADITEEAQAADKGKALRLERAAKMVAIMRGMGFAGAHIGGHGLKYEHVEAILDQSEEFFPIWHDLVSELDYPQTNGWYYFEKNLETGLNSETPVDRSGRRPHSPLSYRGLRLIHHLMFREKGILFRPMCTLARAVDGSFVEHPLGRVEQLVKLCTNDCMHCGDCALFDTAFICPMSQCPKGQRNGPCGGSMNGWCEVYPEEKECIYVRAYRRLKHYKEEETLKQGQVPPVDYDLRHTSSWLNFYMGRDHTAKRMGIVPPKKRGGGE